MGVQCDEAQILISARIDGQLVAGPAGGLDEHLERCPSCRRWEDGAHHLRRATIGRAAHLGERIGLAPLPRGFHRGRVVRLALAWAGLLLVAWNVVEMVEAGSQPSVHLSRHQGAVGVALGLTFLVVAWRPDRAYGLVPFAAVFAAALAITAVIDVVNGASSVLRESRHLVELVGLAFLWILGLSAGPSVPRRWWPPPT